MRSAVAMLCCLAAMSGLAQAQIFICKDASGRTLSADRAVPECADRLTRELSREGIVRREIAAPPTPEQKRQQQLQEQLRQAEAAAVDEQKRRDRLLLATYPSENAIEAARQRMLAPLQAQLKSNQAAIAAAEVQVISAKAEAELHRLKPGESPELRRKMDNAEQAIKSERKSIEDCHGEMAQVNRKYDGILMRQRELVGPQRDVMPGRKL